MVAVLTSIQTTLFDHYKTVFMKLGVPGFKEAESYPEVRRRYEAQTSFTLVTPQGEAAIKLVKGYDHWGWKDPRNSLTLPFWKELLPNLKVVVCVRNPIEVIASLRRAS